MGTQAQYPVALGLWNSYSPSVALLLRTTIQVSLGLCFSQERGAAALTLGRLDWGRLDCVAVRLLAAVVWGDRFVRHTGLLS